MRNIVIGTAGHIDHGKTTLIKALTGRETDTLAEEKKRGISINLGFTYFDLPGNKRAGIVDVPGHEKFIKNMLAGACGIDIALLVVAADEGVMPQTTEHLDILSFLNIKNGIIVLTKCDNVDEEFIELVKEDLLEKIKGTFLEKSDIIQVDSISKKGIENLVKKIDEVSKEIDPKNENSLPRMNIDRIFSVKGFGTVVTGTLIEGKISVEDDLIIYPQNLKTKIRSIQVHGKDVSTAYAGQRTAINISNVKVNDLQRGNVLAKEDSLETVMMLDVKIYLVEHCSNNLKHWDRLRLYHGSREILCRAALLNKEEIKALEEGYVQLRLEEPIVAKKGDVFVLRTYSPMETIGGGIIIDTASRKYKRFDEKIIQTLKLKEKGDLKDVLDQHLKNNPKPYLTIKELITYSGDNEENIIGSIEKLKQEDKVICINNMYMHKKQYEEISKKIINILTDYHKKFRLRNGMLKEEVRSKLDINLKPKDSDALLKKLADDSQIKLENNVVSTYNFNVILNDKQKEISKDIQKNLKNCKLSSILTAEDICKNNNYYSEVLEYMIGNSVEKIDDKHVMDKEKYEEIKKILIDYLNKHGEITLGEYRDLINSSRKSCMIILENFDRNKVTKRIEDKRILF